MRAIKQKLSCHILFDFLAQLLPSQRSLISIASYSMSSVHLRFAFQTQWHPPHEPLSIKWSSGTPWNLQQLKPNVQKRDGSLMNMEMHVLVSLGSDAGICRREGECQERWAEHLGLCKNNFQTRAHPGSASGRESSTYKMHGGAEFSIHYRHALENERAIFSLVID